MNGSGFALGKPDPPRRGRLRDKQDEFADLMFAAGGLE